MKIVDSHCHLDFEVFKDDFHDVLNRAKIAGVTHMQTICTKITHFEQVRKIAEENENIFCSVGIHPNEVDSQPLIGAKELVEYTNHPKVIGLGETGLDYYRNDSDKERQKSSFREHIKASRITGLPLIIHTREAEDDTLETLAEEIEIGVFPGLIHCFTASADFAREALKLGMYISISGIVTFSNAKVLQEIVKTIPLERLLVETDAPYLAPTPNRGKRNEPAFTRDTVLFLAKLKGCKPEEIAEVTTKNFFSLFSKAR